MYLLIDGSNLAFRANYVSNLTVHGKKVSAIYGSLRMLRGLAHEYYPVEQTVICWDFKGSEARRKIYPDYKQNRRTTDEKQAEYEQVLWQIDKLRKVLRLLAVPQLRVRGVEADDLLADLSAYLASKGKRVVVVSSDRDLFQLVGKDVRLSHPATGKTYTPKLLTKTLGYPYERFLYARCMEGDSSDNIPGIRGIGPKKAAFVMNEHRNVADIIKFREEIAAEIRAPALLDANAPEILTRNVRLMKLGLLLTEKQRAKAAKQFREQQSLRVNRKRLRAIFKAYRFSSLLADFGSFVTSLSSR